jgi:hypothetical protein
MTDNDPHLKSGLLPGVLTGLVAMIIGAAAYGALIGFSGYEIGYAAVGVGILVGLAMIAGTPTSPVLPPLAAFFSLIGAVLGQFAGETVYLARRSGLDYGAATGEVLQTFPEQLQARPISILFWAIAAYGGFSFVNKRVKSVRMALAAPSLPQRDEAEYVDNFAPRKQP